MRNLTDRIYHLVRETIIWLEQTHFELMQPRGCAIMQEPWDNLILLDACRYDLFTECNIFDQPVQSRRSLGSSTHDFLEGNFSDTIHHDTVYVTANPIYLDDKVNVDLRGVFHDIVDVWRDSWDHDLGTVRPEPMTEAVKEAATDYPNKRILAHFNQPHHPFLGETGRSFDTGGMRGPAMLEGGDEKRETKVWEQLDTGDLSRDRVWKAYKENLEIVLPYINDLSSFLDGTTVVTSDHGNLLDEFAWPFPIKMVGHPRGIYTRKLTKVPWVELPGETTKSITAEQPVIDNKRVDSNEVTERLADLGYRSD